MKLDLSSIKEAAYALHAQTNEPLCAYIYDLQHLRDHVRRLVSSLPKRCELFYAVKANSDAPMLQTLASEVHGFEVASGGELAWVKTHCPEAPVIFGGPGKTDAELVAALRAPVDCLHVESAGELQRLAWLADREGKDISILLRMNLALAEMPQTSLTMGGRPTPFGMDVQQLPQALEWLQRQERINLRGFHFHLLSHQLDANAHLRLLHNYVQQVSMWQKHYHLQVDQINVGGGIGINYRVPDAQFDWDGFSGGLVALLHTNGLGRYVSASCGCYVMEVLDIKQNLGSQFVVARGGTHHFRTPCAQRHSHPFQVLPVAQWDYPFKRCVLKQSKVNVVGQLCTPKDVLVSDAYVDQLRVGDLLLFPYAGAYAWHISHHDFLRHPHPHQVYLPALQELGHVANQ